MLQSLQGVAYTLGATLTQGRLLDEVEFQVAMKTKEPRVDLIRHRYDRRAREGYLRACTVALSQIRAAMVSGDFLPTAHMCGHWVCSKKRCGWWRECIAEFGGDRPE